MDGGEDWSRGRWRLTLAAMAAMAAGLAGLVAACAAKDGFPDWAFPGVKAEPAQTAAQAAARAAERVTVPGSDRSFPRGQLEDITQPVADWRPGSHPPAPEIVLIGRPGGANACGYCHLPGGEGRPENASLAGLPADYIKAQIAAFRSGARKGPSPTGPRPAT